MNSKISNKNVQPNSIFREAIFKCAAQLCLPNPEEDKHSLLKVLKIAGTTLNSRLIHLYEIKSEKLDCICCWKRDYCQSDVGNILLLYMTEHLKDGTYSFNENGGSNFIKAEDLKDNDPSSYTSLKNAGYNTFISLPLWVDSHAKGILLIESPASDITKTSQDFILLVSYFISSFLWRKNTLDRLNFSNQHDSLTGLKNRNGFIAESSQGFALPLGVIYLDMNGLKAINDQFGHKQGDKCLIKLAHIILKLFPLDSCYRIGGDEYVIICQKITQSDFNNRIIILTNAFMHMSDFSVSVGAHWTNTEEPLDKILGIADQRMYQDKKTYYRNKPLTDRYRSLTDDLLNLCNPVVLEELIRTNNFQVYYQPKFSTKSRKLAGAEALVRYFKSSGVVETPSQFVRLLESTHSISQLDFFVLEDVCQQISKWMEQSIELVPISVNFSKDTLRQSNMVNKISDLLDKYQVPLNLIEIEVTETLEDTKEEIFYNTLRDLKQHGFNIAIDDFGIRHANLNLLIDVDFNTLKIDKSITDSLYKSSKARRFLASITNICRELNISITVEGVETEDQMDVINKLQCNNVQGYLLSHPLPLHDFESQYLFNQ